MGVVVPGNIVLAGRLLVGYVAWALLAPHVSDTLMSNALDPEA
ncbi:hypothetical protein [Demequina sp.]